MKNVIKAARAARSTIYCDGATAYTTASGITTYAPYTGTPGECDAKTASAAIRAGSPIPVKPYPEHQVIQCPPVPDLPHIITLPVDTLRRVALAMAVEDIRYYLNGIWFDTAGQRIAATDGPRVHVMPLALPPELPSFILPACAVERLLQVKKGDVSLRVSTDGRTFAIDGVHGSTIDGKYPDIDRVIPALDKRHIVPFGVDIKKLRTAGKISSKWGSVRLCATGAVEVPSCLAAPNGIAGYTPITGAPMVDMGFRAKYIADMLDAAGGECRAAWPDDAGLSARFDGSGGFVAVVMPMRI